MTRKVDVDGVRAAVNRRLAESDDKAGELAAEAGISAGALSGFRNGKYGGRNDLVAEKLAGIIAERQAFDEITEGRRELWFVVRVNGRVRATKSERTMMAWMEKDPEAIGYTSWWSKDPNQKPFFTRWTGEAGHEAN